MSGFQARIKLHRFLPWLIPLLAYPAFLPFIQHGFFATVDGTLHLLRLVLFDYHWGCRVGELRWVPELYLGNGYPVFNFYAPGTYYLVQALHCVGFDFAQALMLIFCAALLVAGYGVYFLALDLLSEIDPRRRSLAALMAAIAYLYSPYLLTNVYAREAQPEVCAQALLPWVFWSFRRLLVAEHPQSFAPVALFSLAALALSHNITLLLLPPVLIGYLLFVGWQHFKSNGQGEWHDLRSRLAWLIGSGGAAVALTAFFWLPLVSERSYLSQISLGIAAFYMRSGFWSWETVLDWNLPFFYRIAYTNPLGIVQVLLAVIGVIVLWSKQPEWRFWALVAVLCCLGITAPAQPLWMSHPLFLVAQFPWRLLGIASLPLALFSAGLPLVWRQPWLTGLTSIAAIGLITFAHRPVIDPDRNNLHPLQARIDELTIASVAHFEYDTKALGTGSAHEFLPRWSGEQIFLPAGVTTSAEAVNDMQIGLIEAQPFALTLQITQTTARPLHFTNFYFPGWHARIDGQAVAPYPDPVKGLLTVDVPAGEHQLQLAWQGTTSHALGRWISRLTLLLLLLIGVRTTLFSTTQRVGLISIVAVLLILSIWPSQPNRVRAHWQQPIQPTTVHGAQLLGYQSTVAKNGQLHLFTDWYVRNNGVRMRMKWRLLDSADRIVGETESEPYFNTTRSDSWLAGSLVDDAYQIGLAAHIKAGRYRLQLQVTTLDNAGAMIANGPSLLVGEVELPDRQRIEPAPSHLVDARFGEQMALRGYDLTVERNGEVQRPLVAGADTSVIQPGDSIEYRLYWQALGVVQANYHSLLHLLTWTQESLLQRDQLPGTFLNPPRLWSPFQVESEIYRFVIPPQTASGLYRPRLALYNFADGALLSSKDAMGNEISDLFLPTIKIANFTKQSTTQPMIARFGEIVDLYEASSSAPDLRVQPGAILTVTLYYHVQKATDRNYTRFVHLVDAAQTMTAQNDSVPQAGANPTWSWVPGEWILEHVQLLIAPDAKPGNYTLRTGFYDPAADNQRLAAFAADGTLLTDAQAFLATVTIEESTTTP